mmetsp:Transcript_57621/g.150109  ORF Transcript_57621/g.150109 Transcript_57621/m.150109 type:complete len:586 (+) Transcript_57621:88-1845(+)
MDSSCVAGLLQGIRGCCLPIQARIRRGAKRRGTPINDAVRRSLSRHPAPQGAIALSGLRLHPDPARDPNHSYKKLGRLGAGSFGSVYKVHNKVTGQDRAMKVIQKRKVGSDREVLQTEVEAMTRLDHPNVVKFFEFFERDESVCIVTEWCACGDFTQLLRGASSTGEMPLLYRDIVTGVSYIHSLGIVHRDLKFENCLLAQGKLRRVGKVIDFGLSAIRRVDDNADWLQDSLGTALFVAPEVICKGVKYGTKCDLWSLGVMLYWLLSGKHPFVKDVTSMPTQKVLRSISRSPLREQPLANVDPSAQELVRSLLVRDPAKRPDAVAALKSSWLSSRSYFQSYFLQYAAKIGCHSLVHRLTSFAQLSQFKKVALMVIAQLTNHAKVEDSRNAFLSLDVHGRGSLGKQDIQAGFAACGHDLSEDDIEAVFRSLDVDGNQRVSWDEWLAATLLPDIIMSEDAVKGLFSFFDIDDDQRISHAELGRVLSDTEAALVLEAGRVDADVSCSGNEDRSLSWEGFRHLVNQVAHSRRDNTTVCSRDPRHCRHCRGGTPTLQRNISFPCHRIGGEAKCVTQPRKLRRAWSGNQRC